MGVRWAHLSLGIALAVAAIAPATASAQVAWTREALVFQHELASDVPLRNAPWVGTHNSFNSPAEMGAALSAMDSNQRLTLVEQLELGVRSLEIDAHYFLSLADPGTGIRTPVICHATGPHVGCTIEKPMRTVLREIAGWLRRNPGEVLLLYIEDHLDSEAGYDAGAAIVEQELGDWVHRPASGGAACEELPLDRTRREVRSAGDQVVVVSDCGAGSRWRGIAFAWSDHEETRPKGFRDFPDCGPDFDRATYDRTIVRYFEDSTGLTAATGARDDGITPRTAREMARCGVDLPGLDQVRRGDSRLEALVWSWAPGEPDRRGGSCAVQLPGGRWEARRCDQRHRVACRTAGGEWLVSARRSTARRAHRRCGRGGRSDVPRTGYEAQLLRASPRSDRGPVWIALRRSASVWRPTGRRTCSPRC